MSKKTKEVAKATSTEVSTEMEGMFDNSLVSSGDTLDAVDLRIPKLTLIQAMTKATYNTEGAPVGSYIDSIEKTNFGEALDLFIMNDTKLWEVKYDVKEGNKVKTEYLGTIDYNLGNKDLRDKPRIPPELEKRAAEKNVTPDMLSQINMINRFYVLKVEEVLAGTAFPYIVDFKRASYQAGVQLKNSFYKMKKLQKIPSYARVFTLKSEFIQDEYDYYIKTVSSGRMITKDEIEAVETWVREMMTNRDSYSEDNSDDEEAYTVEAEQIEAPTNEEGNPKF